MNFEISNKDSIAFDEVSIIHMCELFIDNYHQSFFGKKSLKHRHQTKLKECCDKLNSRQWKKYRFESSTIKDNILSFVNTLIEKEGNQVRFISSLQTMFFDQTEKFLSSINRNFQLIPIDRDIIQLREVFEKNEINLKREKNQPEDSDLHILKGYSLFITEGGKILISFDEHFWGYHELIKGELDINVIPEWNAHLITCKG